MIAAQVSENILNDKENVSKCCKIIKLELSSCKEIIRVLQDEICENSLPIQSVLNIAIHSSKESYTSSVKEDWTHFLSNR